MNANARVAKKTARKMLNIPFCAYLVQISTTFLLSPTDRSEEIADKQERLHECERKGSEEDGEKDVEHSLLRVLGADLNYLLAVTDRQIGRDSRQTRTAP